MRPGEGDAAGQPTKPIRVAWCGGMERPPRDGLPPDCEWFAVPEPAEVGPAFDLAVLDVRAFESLAQLQDRYAALDLPAVLLVDTADQEDAILARLRHGDDLCRRDALARQPSGADGTESGGEAAAGESGRRRASVRGGRRSQRSWPRRRMTRSEIRKLARFPCRRDRRAENRRAHRLAARRPGVFMSRIRWRARRDLATPFRSRGGLLVLWVCHSPSRLYGPRRKPDHALVR